MAIPKAGATSAAIPETASDLRDAREAPRAAVEASITRNVREGHVLRDAREAPDAAFAQPVPDMLPAKPVEKTSLAQRNNAPDQVTLCFTRWHSVGNTAYQRGEFAGFRIDVAQRLIAGGVAILADTPPPLAASYASAVARGVSMGAAIGAAVDRFVAK